LRLLSFSPNKGAFLIRKVINSAVANAEASSEIDVDNLFIKRLYADEGFGRNVGKFVSDPSSAVALLRRVEANEVL